MPTRSAELAVVAVGGCVGTLARALLAGALPGATGVALVNVLGALLLGATGEVLAARVAGASRRRLWQLGLGTGAMGGFTTYGTLAVLAVAAGWAGVALALVLVVTGVAAAWAGQALGRAVTR